jgi:hypothetical protein
MKWFKHFTNAHNDNAIKKIRMKYGSDGYAIYWYCLELIAGDLDGSKATFELSHDAEVIGYDLKIDQIRVEEIMKYMISLNLFESKNNTITCLKLAKFLDEKNTRNPEMIQIIKQVKGVNVADIPGHAADSPRLPPADKIRLDKNKEKSENKFSDDDLKLSQLIYSKIKSLDSKVKKPNFNKWADTIRLLREVDNRSQQEIQDTFIWANESEFWRSNILSPSSLRKNFTKLDIQRKIAISKSTDKKDGDTWIYV